MNYWTIVCEEPDIWRKWQQENIVTISFCIPEYLAEHPEMTAPNAGYGFARNRVKEMEPGDLIVPFLKDHRIGRVAEFRRENVDDWRPIPGRDDHGRRIEVVWQTEGMPPPDKVALIPHELRRAPIRRTVARLKPERYHDLTEVLHNADYWQDLPVVPSLEDEEPQAAEVDEARFHLERHLEDFIESNFARIEFGRRLELYTDEENTGRQVATAIGSIDLLARDLDTGEFVVIELKKGQADDVVVGQVLRYMGWVGEHLAGGNASVSGIIIAPEHSERLRYALKMVPNVTLFTYTVSFALNAIVSR